jgi:RNA polymerase sigma-70 factor (ECF subfamily)
MDPATQRLGTERDAVLASLRERIVAFAASRLSRDVAEDLTQDVLLLIHEKYPEVERIEELVPLCLRILRFKMMAFYRKAQRRGEQVPADEYPLPDGGPSPEIAAERKEIADRLAVAVAKIGARCKELLRLKLEGRTFPEIRELMGARSINTVYTWDFRCRKHLLELMGGSWSGLG